MAGQPTGQRPPLRELDPPRLVSAGAGAFLLALTVRLAIVLPALL